MVQFGAVEPQCVDGTCGPGDCDSDNRSYPCQWMHSTDLSSLIFQTLE
jgi:hypothetical protein